MNRKGFTLVELLATLIILGIVTGITLVSVSGIIKNSKEKSEDTLANTIEDAIKIYLDSDGRKSNVRYTATGTCLNKTHGKVKLYKAADITFDTIINSSLKPITASDLINPANKKQCSTNVAISLYKDDDFVYYYKVNKKDFNGCWLKDKTTDEFITNLPTTEVSCS